MAQLQTTREVIRQLGGPTAMARLHPDWNAGAIWMWGRRNKFPAETYVIIRVALEAQGHSAPMALWGMKAPSLAAAE